MKKVIEQIKEKYFWKRDFRNQSRQAKRSEMILVNGKEIKASIYIDELAARLPRMKTKSGEPIDHKKNMTELFNQNHYQGIQKYAKRVLGMATRKMLKENLTDAIIMEAGMRHALQHDKNFY